MDKNIFFVSGLPRSGSTLLQNILAQRPDMHVTATSGILTMIAEVRNYWHKVDEFRAMPEAETERKKIQVMRGMLEGYFSDVAQQNIAEKSRGWLAHLELAARVLKREPKVLVPVRDMRDVLCSFEKLWRKTKDTRQIAQEMGNPIEFQTFEGRCAVFSAKGQIVGSCYERIKDAVDRGWRKQMFFVEYEKLTEKPEQTLNEIYEFLKLEPFKHNFDSVQQVTVEDDLVHLFKDLHKIREKVAPQEPTWPILMPKALAEVFTPEAEFWKKL
jgi:sulfotransferase